MELVSILIVLATVLISVHGSANHISIKLKNLQIYEKIYVKENFPDVGALFGVNGKDVTELTIIETNVKEIDPVNLGKLPNLNKLTIDGNKGITTLEPFTFSNNTRLSKLSLHDNSIDNITATAFDGLFTNSLVIGQLSLNGNKLKKMPEFSTSCPGLHHLILDKNQITSINKKDLKNVPRLQTLSMKETGLTVIPDDTFKYSNLLASLDVTGSANLKTIGKTAFVGATSLRKLTLDKTTLTSLPSQGLENLEYLSFKDVNSLWSIPTEVVNLPRLKEVHVPLQRRFLCCAFLYQRTKEALDASEGIKNFTRKCGKINGTSQSTTQMTTRVYSTSSTPIPSTKPSNVSTLKATTTEDSSGPWGRFKRALLWFDDSWKPSDQSMLYSTKASYTDDKWGRHTVTHGNEIYRCQNTSNQTFEKLILPLLKCFPGPDSLRPCDEIMGNAGLTTLSWLVSFLAVVGNGIVFIILVLSRRHFAVTKFLIINLVFADMCLGLYLFVLTCASIDTAGEYYNSIVSWQYMGGCDVVGFLAIFSSELSMLVLTTITIERYLAIVYAVYLQKRLSMKQAWIMVGCSWFISILLALLPLTGVNNYNEVAICLPFSINSAFDKAYLGFVLGFNSLLFMIVLGCYMKIYYEVAGPKSSGRPPSQTNDRSIAKRIALLVFTDFACWLPIAIVGIIAAAGYSDKINMTVEKSKYLLVIFFPINSVCNPFLYALSTKTFRREFYTVLAQCGFCRERLHKFQSNTYTGHSSRRVEKKTRGNTETVTLDAQYSVAPLDNHSTIMKNKTALQKDTQGKKRSTTPTSNPLIDERSRTANNNFIPQELQNHEAAVEETSFTADGNRHPQSLSRDLSIISVVDPMAPLTESAIGNSTNECNEGSSYPAYQNGHVIETDIRF